MRSFDRQRGAIWLAVATGAVAMVAGCSSSASGSGSDPSPTAVASTAIATTEAAPAPSTTTPTAGAPDATTTSPGPTTAPTVAAGAATVTGTAAVRADPNATLQQALVALTDTYHFTSTALVNGAVALVADGDRVGDGSRFTVTANGTSVGYVITADGTWVQQPGAAWQQIHDPPATADPIAALRAPSAVTLASADATTSQLFITVPGTSLGLEGDSGVTVQATVIDGALGAVAYSTTVGASPATITSTFGPAADAGPVAPPA